jgi:hypothetical protein
MAFTNFFVDILRHIDPPVLAAGRSSVAIGPGTRGGFDIARTAHGSGHVGYENRIARPSPLKKAKVSLNEIGLIELNEAFASQAIACMRELKFDIEKFYPKTLRNKFSWALQKDKASQASECITA